MHIKIKNFKLLYLLVLFVGSAHFQACNTVKYVPENKLLLKKNVIISDTKEIPNSEFDGMLRQTPNKRFLRFFKMHLGIYNLSKPGSEKFLSRNLRKMGEAPVIFDPLYSQKTKEQFAIYLANKGFYNSQVSDSLVINNQEVTVFYKITSGVPYRINAFNYKITDDVIRKIVLPDSLASLIKTKNLFDAEVLQNERIRIETQLRQNGYFGFSREFVYYEVDSALGENLVNITLCIKNQVNKDGSGELSESRHVRYKIGNIRVHVENQRQPDTTFSESERILTQMLERNNINVVYHEGISVKPSTIVNSIYLTQGQIYNQQIIDETYRALSALKVFRYINILFTEHPWAPSDTIRTIDCRIQLATSVFQSYQADAEITSSSGIGAAGSYTFQHKNLFRGAETFNLRFKGATEAVKKQTELAFKNTLELGTEASIVFPKFILPFRADGFTRKYNPNTSISASYNYLRRINYSHRIVNISYGYNWKGSRNNSFIVSPLAVNFVKMLHATDEFMALIANTYLKYSFEDHLLVPSSFSYIYNNQQPGKNLQFTYFRFNAETSGNTIRQISKLVGAEENEDGNYKLFGVQFAQYVKADFDIRYYQPVNSMDKVVFRLFSGLAFPYGNSRTIPFEKQYFSGGANSIRAWQVRSLGPGAFFDTNTGYPDKASDIKLEANIEYRFKLFWIIEGALFLDAGNIWSINKNDNRPGAMFNINSFTSQIALGSGFGTRFDFSFFVFRFDLGVKLYNPANNFGERWVFNQNVGTNILNLTVGIGYPF